MLKEHLFPFTEISQKSQSKFNNFKDSLRVLQIYNCLNILQMIRAVGFAKLKFLLLEYSDIKKFKEYDNRSQDYFNVFNKMSLESLALISLKMAQIHGFKVLEKLES
ncbi:hypothetical protein DASC09_029780 [Saccharomycopsis crataegensis]|uniref:Uncharacterized protein n=1 Tax=Saccharomycopsis crataegensis TaxID=43959 RepID=A0AAV5QNB6_9ASCO|nr:hypothetical protein DASC09_029780 [Saccharomycopsis crataegensis]